MRAPMTLSAERTAGDEKKNLFLQIRFFETLFLFLRIDQPLLGGCVFAV